LFSQQDVFAQGCFLPETVIIEKQFTPKQRQFRGEKTVKKNRK